MLRSFLIIILTCAVRLLPAQTDITVGYLPAVSSFASEKEKSGYVGMPLQRHQHANYTGAGSYVRGGALNLFNAVPKQLLLRKPDSLKKDARKLAKKVKRFIPVPADGITVNIYYHDQRRYGVGAMLHCTYFISTKRIKKHRDAFLQVGREVVIPPDVNRRLDSFALECNQFIMYDTINLSVSLVTLSNHAEKVTFADTIGPEKKDCLKLLFNVLGNSCNQFTGVSAGYLDQYGLADFNSIGLSINWQLILYYDENKRKYCNLLN